MINPIKIGRTLKDVYLTYLDTGIPLREKCYFDERRKLYEEDGVIMQSPIIEIVNKYDGVETITDCCKKNDLSSDISDFLNTGLLHNSKGEEIKIYEHQKDAFLSVVKEKKNMIVTTGTGSGKTECFMIPVISNLVEESKSWPLPEEREHAVRTLIMYPLNALAEDQMVRLRKSLEDENIKNWLDKNRKQNRFTFGRYTGRTPGKPSETRQKSLERFKGQWENLKKHKETNPEIFEELKYSIPCTDENSAELIVRQDMQTNPPDILITNYSMLNIMLMRKREEEIFEKTKQWLKEDKNHVFTIVIDELHTYRGTAGTEVSYILKVLLNRIGLTPDSKQVRFLASSASMDKGPKTEEFLSDFFGVPADTFRLINDKTKPIVKKENLKPLPIEIFNEICNENIDEGKIDLLTSILQKHGFSNLYDFVQNYSLQEWLTYSLQDEDGCVAARSVKYMVNRLFEKYEKNEKYIECLISLINLTKDPKGNYVQPIRTHYFARNVDNIWICSSSNCSALEEKYKSPTRKFGKLYSSPVNRCTCGAKVYEAIVCRQCGEIFLSGFENDDNSDGKVYLENNKPLLSDNVLIPTIIFKKSPGQAPFDEGNGRDNHWLDRHFDSITGEIVSDRSTEAEYCIYDKKDSKAPFPERCPACDWHIKYDEEEQSLTPLYHHGTGVQKLDQVFADSLTKILKDKHEKSKLILFSDSRQGAAKLSAGIELDHYRDEIRLAMLDSLDSDSSCLTYLKKYRNNEIEYRDIPEELRKGKLKEPYFNFIKDAIRSEKEGDEPAMDLDSVLNASNTDVNKIVGGVIEKLLKTGINPAGPYPSYQTYGDFTKWTKAINWPTYSFKRESEEQEAFATKINIKCRAELLNTAFGSNKRTFEQLGIGYFKAKNTNGVEQEFIDSAIRIMGESWRIYDRNRKYAPPTGLPNRLWKYIENVYGEKKRPPYPKTEELKNAFITLGIVQAKDDITLTGEGIEFVKASDCKYLWKCKRCSTVHLHHSMGVCTFCGEKLTDDCKYETSSYIKLDTMYINNIFGKELSRLHCEELTGQTDDNDALDRQRLFQDLIKDNEVKEVDAIDLLSVTTTMEAGVDIGSLSAVMMGNVPPQRFNYQQRVGRAGRRNTPLSLALTVARVNSHDQTHYSQPERMVSGQPAIPYIDLRSIDILKRFVIKEVLRRAYIDKKIEPKESSVHGEFGTIDEWTENSKHIESWLASNKSVVQEIINTYADDNKISDDEKRKINDDIINNLVANISEKIRNKDKNGFIQHELSEFLAASGMLPMFGFPTQVRYLYEAAPKKFPPEKVTDRQMDMALTSFTPGCEIVKDKKVLKSIGFVTYIPVRGQPKMVNGLHEFTDKKLLSCKNCSYLALEDKNAEDKCPICKCQINPIENVASPLGYRTEYGKAAIKDFDGRFDWLPVASETRIDSKQTEIKLKEIASTNLLIGNNEYPEKGVVNTINTNQDNLFSLVKAKKQEGWYDSEVVKYKTDFDFDDDTRKDFALISSKVTGVLEICIYSNNKDININPLFNSENETLEKARLKALKGAILSWGNLLRKGITNYLDIETKELTVDYFVRRENESDASVHAGVFMVEQLENGAGYTSFLGKTDNETQREIFIKPLLPKEYIYENLTKDSHIKSCDCSCYDCLRDYYNQKYHDMLDWRLGLDLARISNDDEYLPTYMENNGYWHDLLKLRLEAATKQENENITYEKKDEIYIIKSNDIKILLAHPFWSQRRIDNLLKKYDLKDAKVIYMNDFIQNLKV